jgi:hypothetical protein
MSKAPPDARMLASWLLFSLWQALHRLWRLLSDSLPPAHSGTMWSTSTAGVTIPSFMQSSHAGLANSFSRLIF